MPDPIADNPSAPPADTAALLHQLRAEVAREQRRKRWPSRMRLFRATFTLLWLVFFLERLEGDPLYPLYSRLCGLAAVAMGVAALAFVGDRRKDINTKVGLIYQLREEVQAVGLLAMIVHHNLSEVPVQRACENLKTLLPRLQPANAEDFTPETMDATLHLLNSEDSTLVIAALTGLEQVGDARALIPVQKLAGQTQNFAVQAMAQECLPCLEERVRQQARARTLLRPSQAEPSPPAILLRPVAPVAQDADGTQLLHPTGQG